MREVLLYLQRPGKTLPEKKASPRSGFPCWIFSFYKNLYIDFDKQQYKGAWLSCSLLLPPSFLEYSNIYQKYPHDIHKIKYKKSLLPKVCQKYTQDIPKISPRYSRWNIRNPFFPKFVKNVPKMFPKYPQDIPIFYREEFKGAWLACTLFFPYSQCLSKISPRYPQATRENYKNLCFFQGGFRGAWLACTLFSPPLVREPFTTVCHSPTISFREHLATAICNPAAPPNFYYSDFLHSITFEEGTTPHDRYQDKYLWRHGDYGSMLRGQREKEAGKRCINLSMCMICVIVPGWVGEPILATSAISPVSTSCVTSLALGTVISGMCV